MSFRENLLKKIEIGELSERVARSLGTLGSGKKIDRKAMQRLLELAGWRYRRERDLDLYLPTNPEKPDVPLPDILVLDNELPWYRTTVEDVAMRRSPEIREMVSIRNIIKILNDKDILLARGEETVSRIRDACFEGLDLTYTADDLEAVKFDGQASMESRYPEGVIENLMLFAEVLGWQSAPGAFQVKHCSIYGKIGHNEKGQRLLGPAAVFQRIHQELKFLDGPFNASQPEELEKYRAAAAGDAAAALRGTDVFQKLLDLALASG